MKNDNRPDVGISDFYRWKEYSENEWEWLTPTEKAACLSYQKQLADEKVPSLILIKNMNLIHNKNKDFHVGLIPSPPVFMTQDFSAYEPQDLA